MDRTPIFRRTLIGIRTLLVLVFIILIAVGSFLYRSQYNWIRLQAEREIRAVTELKATQIANWRHERLDEGKELRERPLLNAALIQWLTHPNESETGILKAELVVLKEHDDYADVVIVDADGKILMGNLPNNGALYIDGIESLAEAEQLGEPVMSPLHSDPHMPEPHVHVTVPIFADLNTKMIGALMLVSKADQYIYPLLDSWPIPTQTGETVMMRRDGNEAVYLSNLRHEPGSALQKRVPLAATHLPAVQGALDRTGIFWGKDYRDATVLSAVASIQGSDWYLLGKMDAAEAFAELRLQSVLLLALLLALAALIIVVVAVVRQWDQKIQFRKLYESEAKVSGLSRLYAMLSGTNQLIVRSPDRQTLFSGACRTAVDDGGFDAAWIGLLQEDRKMVPVARAERDRATIPDLEAPELRAEGGAFDVLCQQVKEGVQATAAVPAGGSVGGFPILHQQSVIGGLFFYTSEDRYFERNESATATMAEMAVDISFALDNYTRDEESARVSRESQASSERLAHYLATSPVVNYVLRVAGEAMHPIWISENIERITGFTQEEALAADWWRNHVFLEDLAGAEAMAATLWNEGSIRQEYRFHRKDGSIFWVLDSMELERDEQGNPVQVIGAWSDVTKIKMAEESARLHSAALESVANAVVITDKEGNIEWANRAFSELTGYDLAECVGRNPRELVRSGVHDSDFYKSMWDTVLAGNTWHGEVINRRKDGSHYTEEMTVTALRDTAGVITHFIAVKQDITQRKDDEARRRADEARFLHQRNALIALTGLKSEGSAELPEALRRITETAASTMGVRRASVWRFNADQSAIECMDLYDTITEEHTSGTILNRSDFPIYFETLEEHDFIAADDALTDAGTREFKEDYLMPLGITSMLDAPVQMAGKLAGVLCCEHVGPPRCWTPDEKTFGVALASLVSLAMESADRARLEDEQSTLQAEFNQAQKMESVGRLAGGVAHDFNNLLSVIIGYTDFAIDNLPESHELQKDFEQIKKSATRAADLTRQLLAFSRRQALSPVVLNANATISNLEKMLRRLIGEDISFELQLQEGLGMITADPGQLEQVLMNLAVNARDAMPHGGSLTIRTENVALDEEFCRCHLGTVPGPHVRISVIDTGHGMDQETMDKAFEPFFTTKVVGKGTGLGLATVYGIVKQSGGSVWVYSQVGQGTRFDIYLPKAEASGTAKSEAESAEVPGGTETILLVEDDAPLRMLTERLLKRAGYRVVVASNGEDALDKQMNFGGPIHILLTDVVMPGMSGRDLSDALTNRCRGVKTIFMSGYLDDNIAQHGVLDPDLNLVTKPFSASTLCRKIRSVLDSNP